jgi:hypothetical protein
MVIKFLNFKYVVVATLFIGIVLALCACGKDEAPTLKLEDRGVYGFVAVGYESVDESSQRLTKKRIRTVNSTGYYVEMDSDDGSYRYYEPADNAFDAKTAAGFLTTPVTAQMRVFTDKTTGTDYFVEADMTAEQATEYINGEYSRLSDLSDL